jgi:hypothetical protein
MAATRSRRSPAKKAPSTQAGKFVAEEMHEEKRGKGRAQSHKQAIAIGLSRARRAGVKVKPNPNRGRKSTSGRSAGRRAAPGRSSGRTVRKRSSGAARRGGKGRSRK